MNVDIRTETDFFMRFSKIIGLLAIYLSSGFALGQLSTPNAPSVELLEILPGQAPPSVVNPLTSTPVPVPVTNNTNTSRRGSLLESPWKIGYGRATTGAGYNGSLYTVTNTNDTGPGSLRQGIETPNTWVVYSPSLDGKTIFIKSSLRPAANTTWDGRDALVRIAPHSSVITDITMIRLDRGNSIMHRVSVGPEKSLRAQNGNGTNWVTAILVSSGEKLLA